MSPETRELITWSLTTGGIVFGALAAAITGAVRLLLVPYLREQLIKPLEVVRRQVDENHHHNVKPTLLDRLDDVERVVLGTQADVQDLKLSRDEEQVRLARGDARMEKIETSIGHVSQAWLGWRDRHEVTTQESLDRIRRLERRERAAREIEDGD